jgi:hypothetical protein
MAVGDADPGPSLDAELLAAEVAESLDEFLDHMSVAEGIGAKLNRQLLGFLKTEVLPQANRAAEMGVDPTPLFAMVVRVLRTYADALQRPPSAGVESAFGRRPIASDRQVRRSASRAGPAPGPGPWPRCVRTPRACGRWRRPGS